MFNGVKRDSDKVEHFLRSYSRHISTQATVKTITSDVVNNFDSIDRKTVSEYIKTLKNIYVIEELKAWSPTLRSKTTIATSSTRHFVDPAIAAYFLDASPDDLFNDLQTMGLLFESLVVRDLRIYVESLDGKLFHYRDHNGLEADAVLHFNNGNCGAVEVKLGDMAIKDGAENLLKLKDKINTDKMNAPSFLAVITASGFAYQRPDEVYVIPIGCLRN